MNIQKIEFTLFLNSMCMDFAFFTDIILQTNEAIGLHRPAHDVICQAKTNGSNIYVKAVNETEAWPTVMQLKRITYM